MGSIFTAKHVVFTDVQDHAHYTLCNRAYFVDIIATSSLCTNCMKVGTANSFRCNYSTTFAPCGLNFIFSFSPVCVST